ncbi:MAG: methyltetrahydrofolate cobalamin methyltransferase, partial [Candidatus Omnitrophota bacterium]
SVNSKNGIIFIQTLKKIKEIFPDVKTTCGLSNISFGLPKRRVLNRYFLAILISAGLDSAILDPVDPGIREALYASEVLTGKDEFCINYIKAYRENKI